MKTLLEGLVGVEGAAALSAAATRIPHLESAVLPRALFSWLALAAPGGYDAPLPGLPDTRLVLEKSEDGVSGVVEMHGNRYDFQAVSLLHVSAAIGVLSGLDPISADLSDEVLARLGKSVDLLVKARAVREVLAKSEAPDYEFEHERSASPPTTTTVYATLKGKECGKAVVVHDGKSLKIKSWTIAPDAHPTLESKMQDAVRHITGLGLEKADEEGRTEGPGPAHKPTEAAGAIAPSPPSRQQNQPPKPRRSRIPVPPPPKVSIPKIPLLKSIRTSTSSLSAPCPVCDAKQVVDGTFVGCWCFRDLAADVSLRKNEGETVVVTFGARWDENAVLAFLDSVRGGV